MLCVAQMFAQLLSMAAATELLGSRECWLDELAREVALEGQDVDGVGVVGAITLMVKESNLFPFSAYREVFASGVTFVL